METRILLVEDDPAHRELISRALKASGLNCRITTAETLAAARQLLLETQPFDLAMVDLHLPDGNGIDLLQVDTDTVVPPVVVMTSHGSEEVAVDALKRGACDYLVKSVDRFRDVGQLVQRVLREQQLINERRAAEIALAQSHDILAGLMDSLKPRIAVLDEAGEVVIANRQWRDPSLRNPLAAQANDVGDNYLQFCKSLTAPEPQFPDAETIVEGIRSVMEGQVATFRHEYAVDTPVGHCWFETIAAKFNGAAPARVVIAHDDVTSRKQQELHLQRRAAAQGKLSLLSPREREVLELVVDGHPNKVIAKRLDLSEKTVEKHRASVMKKLNLQSVAELVRLAMQAEKSSTEALEN